MSGHRNHKHAVLLLALALGMFGFAFALVPLYNVFCDITGINGKTAGQAASIDELRSTTSPVAREVTIQLLAKAARGLPWEFRPTEEQLRVRVGEMRKTTFYVRNRADVPVTGQAVPSVSPGQAALFLKKLECFCFTQQYLDAGGEMEMPVTFYIADDLPADINELSLSYTMFRIDSTAQEQSARNR